MPSASRRGWSTGALLAFLALFFVASCIVGPVAEELYIRGHLLPRIDRYGRGAPVLNTVLFLIYHFHTPWRYPVILLGYLPIAWTSWRRRSLWDGLAAHMDVNNMCVLMMLAAYAQGNEPAQHAAGTVARTAPAPRDSSWSR